MAKTKSNARSQIGYLAYNDIADRITNQILDMYDVVFTSDTHECFVISPDLIPFPIKSRVYTFNTIEEAETTLNQSADTYQGQFVAILNNGKYIGYIVNQTSEKYTVSPISEGRELDYNTLGNRPIVNMIGTLDEPIMVSDLSTGIYKIKGQYKISDLEETIYLSASDTLFIINNETDMVQIKKITSDEIVNYSIANNTLSFNEYITSDYLKDNSYADVSYVDSKIEAMKLLLQEDMKSYIAETIDTTLGETIDLKIDKKIDTKIDELIQPTSDEQISNLF